MFPEEWLRRFDGQDYMGMYRRTMGDEGAEAIAKYLHGHPTMTKIDMTINEIGPAGAVSIGKALPTMGALRELNFSLNPIGCQGAKGLAEGIGQNRSLTDIDLHGDAIGTEGMVSVAFALQSHPSLTSVTLYSNKGGDECCSAFSEMLERTQNLRVLNLGANDITSRGVSVLLSRGLGSLRSLVLSHNALGDAAMAAFASAGSDAFRSLEDVALAGCGIGPAGFMEISRVVMPSVRVIDLSDNDAGDGEGLALALANTWPSLTDIDLTSTRVSVGKISRALTSHGSLSKASLGGTGAESRDITALCQGISSGGGALKILDLSDNNLVTGDAESLAAACRENTRIEEIILYGNDDIDDEAVDALEEVLGDMARLE